VITRLCDTCNALVSLMHGKRCVFKFHLKRSDLMAGSCNELGSEFQTIGTATEIAWVPKVLRRNRRIFSLRRLAERRCWQPETSETGTCSSWRSTLELGTKDAASLYCTHRGIVSQWAWACASFSVCLQCSLFHDEWFWTSLLADTTPRTKGLDVLLHCF